MPSYLADTSVWAWARSRPSLTEKLAARMADRELATCVPIALELLHAARDGAEYEDVLTETLAPARWLACSDEAALRALSLQRRLASTTHGAHRISSMDYLVVGIAAEAGPDVVVWHADRDLARLCELADHPHEHERIRPR